MSLDAIVFDLDNTLIDRDAALRRFLVQVAGADCDAELIAEAMAVDARGYASCGEFCGWWAARTGCDADALWAEMRRRLGSFVERDAARLALVRRLIDAYAVAIVTNGGADNQWRKLRASGLDRLIDASRVIVSAEVGVAKPGAAIFELALARLGVPAGRALFVGDHPEHDIAGADAVGMHTCWVSHGRVRPPAFDALTRAPAVIASVLELPELLDAPRR